MSENARIRAHADIIRRWAIGDDYERDSAVREASDADLKILVQVFEDTDDEFNAWFAQYEIHHVPEELKDLMSFRQAAEYAYVVLDNRSEE